MNRHASYSQSYHAAPTHRYPSTSSAFSASANPNEDWTKISDLAERRRIQNRIAQRNYRKKLKKRLEDLERRAASNSASPEQKPAELVTSTSPKKSALSTPEQSLESPDFTPSFSSQSSQPATQYLQAYDGRDMFSQQYTRQLSTSPPPFAYSTYPSEPLSYPSFSQDPTYGAYPATVSDLPLFPPYLPPLSSSIPTTLSSLEYPAKQEPFLDAEINPFNMTYASMAGIDISAAQSYTDSNPHTPPLSECFEQSVAGSPPDTSLPPTPPFSTLL